MNARCRTLCLLLLILFLAAGCGRPTAPARAALPHAEAGATAILTSPAPTPQPGLAGLSPDEIATLDSLEQVDGYPLYTMRYYGPYAEANLRGDLLAGLDPSAGGKVPASLPDPAPGRARVPAWACSLFAALGDAENRLYGRNFDWEPSPALLLFTAPPDGYASASMVDIAYLGFGGAMANRADKLPIGERRSLLGAPFLPFDGMNDRGLAVGMAAVPPGDMKPDPSKESIGSMRVMRELLDHAQNVDEALALLERYNVVVQGSVPIHYLIADRSGRAVLVEFYQGEMHVIPNETPWHLATSFLRASVGDSPAGQCPRYDAISRQLQQAQGRVTAAQAMSLLAKVAQPGTQWSVVYGMSTGEVQVAMGRQYGDVHSFSLLP
jgi:hypothetical protein